MTTSQIIEITSAASKQLEKVLAEQDQAGSMLRVMVMPGPQGGYQYMLGVEDNPTDSDVVIDSGDLKVLVDGESVPMVEGAQIDYVDGLMRSGFVISNPNMPSGGGGGCGCGGGGGGGCGGGGGGGCACGGGGGGGCACGGGGGGGGCGGGGGGCACGGH